MARVRFIGPEPVTVPELGSREVQPDQVVDVPDDRFEGYVCQPVWEPVEEPGVKASAAAKRSGARASQKES